MADWNTLFKSEDNIEMIPESEVFKFFQILLSSFDNKDKIKIWDLGCGAGRNSLAFGKLGAKVYISDNSQKALELTEEKLKENKVEYVSKKADMEVYPWDEIGFLEGVFSWAVLQHNTYDNIVKTVENIYNSLVTGGYFMGSVMSSKSKGYGKGEKIEENTFLPISGKEKGVPHHYFDLKEVNELFPESKWERLIIAEQVVNYIEKTKEFKQINPFKYTDWYILLRKI